MKKIIIIGGGINGLCSAYYLSKMGHQVQIIERESENYRNCSDGNAGVIVPSHFIPLASPGMVKKGIRYMFNSSSPFFIRPRLKVELIRWAYAFYISCSKKNVQEGAPLLRAFHLLSKSLYKEIKASGDFDFDLKERGMIMLYQTERQRQEEIEIGKYANELGIEAITLSKKEVEKIEDRIEIDVLGGVHFTGDVNITPQEFIRNLKTYLSQQNVEFIYGEEVLGFNQNTDKTIASIQGKKDQYAGDEFILAAGAWTAQLCKKIGVPILLQGGKGYSFDLPEIDSIQIPSILCEAKVAVSPMNGYTRFSGTLEINETDLSIQPKRVQGIVNAIRRFYPKLTLKDVEKNAVWSGLRPCSPDGIPYLGKPKDIGNLIVATGHGMMGISLGPATGKLVSEIIENQETSINLEAMKLDRFE